MKGIQGVSRSVLMGLFPLLTACSGHHNNGGSEDRTITLVGQAFKGPISGGVVTAYETSAVVNAAYTSTTTDAGGNYSLTVSNYIGGPIWLEVTGGTYTDEVTGASVSVPATVGYGLQAVVNVQPGGTVQAEITPLTSMAAGMALEMNGGLSRANVNTANQQVSAHYGGIDILTTRPIDPRVAGSATGASQASINYGLILAGFSQEANTLNLTNPFDLVADLIQDFWDGDFDGQTDQAFPAPLYLEGTVMNPAAGTTDFATAVSTFSANPALNVSGGTVSPALLTDLLNPK